MTPALSVDDLVCQSTGKRAYASREFAVEKMDEVLARPDLNPAKQPRNVYRCEHCCWWHMTSREEKR